ncbi:MAG: hypothetical protein HOI21_05685 [Bacteroidetes Order II. Incertae sedis bacterium]|jgi:hypothetical protein|nr:hypothetical protein [Bacteroidetes Order II. bacterium]
MEIKSHHHQSVSVASLFPLGQVVATPGAIKALEEASMGSNTLLRRHQRGDWGHLSVADRDINTNAVSQHARLFSAYELRTGKRIWVITEADRSSTTMLLPPEY